MAHPNNGHQLNYESEKEFVKAFFMLFVIGVGVTLTRALNLMISF